MKKKRIIVAIIGFMSVIVLAVILNVTHIWKNNSYHILAGNHLNLVNGDKFLFWFDVIHSNNPDDVMFRDLESELLKNTPDLVLVEGSANTFQGDRETAIFEGESAFATFIAKQNGIIVEDIEPPFSKQIDYLQTKYSPDEILAMYLLRQIGSESLMPEQTGFNFDTYLENETAYLIENGLKYQSTDLNSILSTLNTFLSEPINKENWRDMNVQRVYAKGDSVIHSVYTDIVDYRNIYLVELINERKQLYNKIFVVMGGQHLKDTKKQLQEIYSTTSYEFKSYS